MSNIDSEKLFIKQEPKYKLKKVNVYESNDGYHFIKYLDPVENIASEIDPSKFTSDEALYIEHSLQSKDERFENQAKLINKYFSPGDRILDIGCGGGLFLSKIKDLGFNVMGIELNDSRAYYAISKYNIKVIKYPIENEFWEKNYTDNFNAITLWDVIEHVNYPVLTIKSSLKVLKKDGLLFIDTPCRDSFYYRFGEFTYWISNGKFPSFLNIMFSADKFGHKQIFSTPELREIFEDLGLKIIKLQKFHELSFPYKFYMEKLFKNKMFVELMLPIIRFLIRILPVKNKMLIIGQKTFV